MSVIHQLYCTHCTHGSSALERSQGELAARMLGYSVRAGSLEGDPLRQVYRQVERYISYHLPRDTPGQVKLEWTAQTAPRRLVFIPSAGALQIIAQISYRARDSEGRPGSYFAHVLCREIGPEQPAWTAVDALRLWNAAGWVAHDDAKHPFVLPVLTESEALLGGRDAAIDDVAFLRFLQGASGTSDSWLPDRWRRMSARQRAAVFQWTLSALIAAGTTRRQTVLLAVEPEVAALLFYGAARLMPPGEMRASIGFSTFEPSADRLVTPLAATTFYDPQTAEFRTDELRGRGVAINTFRDLGSEGLREGSYGPGMMRRLLDEGWDSVDRRLKMFAAAGPKRVEALEAFALTERTVAAWFDSPEALANEDWRKQPELIELARRLVVERLGGEFSSAEKRAGLGGHPSLATIAELAAVVPPGQGPDDAIDHLLDLLPEPQVEPLLRLPRVADDWKVRLLVRRIEQAGRMPAGCEWIWDDNPPPSGLSAERCRELGVRLLQGLSGRAAATLLAAFQSPRLENAVDRLLEACSRAPACWSVFADLVRGMNDAALIAAWQRCGSRLFATSDHDGGMLAGRLKTMLRSLAEHAAEFPQRFAFLVAGREHLVDPADQKRLDTWDACREAICDLASAGKKVSGWGGPLLLHRLEAAAKRMAEAASAAMPPAEFTDDARSTRKEQCLRTIGAQLLAGEPLLPEAEWHNDALWKKVRWRFEMGRWPSIPLRKLAFGGADRNRIWIAAGIAAAVVLGVLVVIGLATMGTGKRSSKAIVLEPRFGREADRPGGADPASTSRQGQPAAPGSRKEGDSPPPAAAGGTMPDATPPAVVTEPLIFEPADADPFAADRAPALPPTPGSNAAEAVPPQPGVGGEPSPAPPPAPEETTPPAGTAAPPQPLITIDGEFKAAISPARELKPPSIASVRLVVKGVGGRPLPDRILKDLTIGAVIVETGGSHIPRYIELPDLSKKRDAEVFDGAESVLVWFQFARRTSDPADQAIPAVAGSYAGAQIPIEAGKHYEVRFELTRPAVGRLEAIVEKKVSQKQVR